MKELGEFSGIKKRQELRQQQLLRRTEQLIQSEDVHADVSDYKRVTLSIYYNNVSTRALSLFWISCAP